MIRGARIVFNRGNSIFPCTIVDFTDDGATVKTLPDASLPRFFLLELADGRRFHSTCVDRTKDVIDLKFEKQVG